MREGPCVGGAICGRTCLRGCVREGLYVGGPWVWEELSGGGACVGIVMCGKDLCRRSCLREGHVWEGPVRKGLCFGGTREVGGLVWDGPVWEELYEGGACEGGAIWGRGSV